MDTLKAIRDLKDDNPAVRAAAAQALGDSGGPYIAMLLLGLDEDPDERVRAAAIASLGRIDPMVLVSHFIRMLGDPSAAVGGGAGPRTVAVSRRRAQAEGMQGRPVCRSPAGMRPCPAGHQEGIAMPTSTRAPPTY